MPRKPYTRDEITEKVSQILSANYFDTPPVDIYKLIENYGIIVHNKVFPLKHANVSGFIVFPDDEEDTAIFVLNKADSEERKKFTLAHEFGHWILHKKELTEDPTLSVLYKSPIGGATTDQIEVEANLFAAQILVPDTMLETEHSDQATTSVHRKDLALKFGVGEDIIGFRLDLRNDAVAEEPAEDPQAN